MPKNEKGEVKCLNNPQHEMINPDRFSAITGLEKQPDGSLAFLPSHGIAVVVFVCKDCGYLEIYHKNP